MGIKETREKIINELKDKKEYQVTYKFSDVVETIEAGSQEEVEQIADERINCGRYSPDEKTYCYEVEAEEV